MPYNKTKLNLYLKLTVYKQIKSGSFRNNVIDKLFPYSLIFILTVSGIEYNDGW